VIATLAGIGFLYFRYFTPEKRIVRHHLSETDAKSEASIRARLKPLAELFAKGRKGAKGFAQDALSLDSKWQLVKGTVCQDESHRKFLAEAFARHVFSSDELKGAMESAVRAYLDDVEGYESEMLVKLRADLADPARTGELLPAHLQRDEEFRREYQKLSGRLVNELRLDLGVSVGREVGVMVASTAAAQIAMQAARAAATELGISAGLLGTGTASSIATLGVGTILMFIIDYIVGEVFKAVGYDPEAKIETLVCESINKMEAALTSDSGVFWMNKKGSLRERMEQLHESRSTLRRATITRLLKDGGLK
jgi:hypothetical protein